MIPTGVPVPSMTQHAAFLGMQGSGKSYAHDRFVAPYYTEPRMWLDFEGEYIEGGEYTPNGAKITSADQPDFVKSLIDDPKNRDVVVMVDTVRDIDRKFTSKPDLAKWPNFEKVMQYHWTSPVKRRVVIDEVYNVSAQDGYQSETVGRLARQGRKHGKTLTTLTQRFAMIPKSIVTQANHLYLFRMSPYDAERIEQIYQSRGGGVADALTSMPLFDSIHLNPIGDVTRLPFAPRRVT